LFGSLGIGNKPYRINIYGYFVFGSKVTTARLETACINQLLTGQCIAEGSILVHSRGRSRI